jgi:hypothetical protein
VLIIAVQRAYDRAVIAAADIRLNWAFAAAVDRCLNGA